MLLVTADLWVLGSSTLNTLKELAKPHLIDLRLEALKWCFLRCLLTSSTGALRF